MSRTVMKALLVFQKLEVMLTTSVQRTDLASHFKTKFGCNCIFVGKNQVVM